MQTKTALVLGAGGFIGNHLVNRLISEGYWVRGVDLKHPEFQPKSRASEFIICDLRDSDAVSRVMWSPFQTTHINGSFDEVYQLAADMGGAGYIFSGDHDADVMTNSALINLHVANYAKIFNVKKLFFSSSACMYPAYNQEDPSNPNCTESSAYPAAPDSEYGWEKLFSERLYLSYYRNYGLEVRIARFHNIFGPLGTWKGGKEKAPAAICRKVAEVKDGDQVEVWGDGKQTRSFLYIDECIEGIRRLMQSDFTGPVNIGSDEMVSINDLVDLVISVSNKRSIEKKHITGPIGVAGRNSCNKLIKEKLGWAPSVKLLTGLIHTYNWVEQQVQKERLK